MVLVLEVPQKTLSFSRKGFFMLLMFMCTTASLTAVPLSEINDASVHGVSLSL